MQLYRVERAEVTPRLDVPLSEEPWRGAGVAPVGSFHPAGSDHRPKVEARLLYGNDRLWVRFRVDDRHVRVVHTRFQDPVYEDSCCELFIEPVKADEERGDGYFNVEVNAIGALQISYITDPIRRPEGGFAGQRVLDDQADREIERWTTLTEPVDPQIEGPITYEISYSLPFALLKRFSGRDTPKPGSRWRGNLYKCSENSTHPHWGAWSSIGQKLDYHQPSRFGVFEFA